jgi:hypothetical protein
VAIGVGSEWRKHPVGAASFRDGDLISGAWAGQAWSSDGFDRHVHLSMLPFELRVEISRRDIFLCAQIFVVYFLIILSLFY